MQLDAFLVQEENVFEVMLSQSDNLLELIVEEGKADKENLDWCREEQTANDADLADRLNELDTSLTTSIDDRNRSEGSNQIKPNQKRKA